MVKIYREDGKKIDFDSKNVEDNLKAAGLPEGVAKEVAERVGERVENGWTSEKVNEETDRELRQLQEDIDRVHNSFKGQLAMGEHYVGEQRNVREDEYPPGTQPRSETKVELRSTES